jgi:two-component system, NtrC family, nitrogen regulation sensor histidine kinase NtrY
MSLRFKFILYLIIVHLLFAGVAAFLLRRQRIWLLAVEAVSVLSLGLGLKLIRDLFGTLELINAGAQFLQDSDFTARFREVGQPELDRLVRVYNRMVDHLREERTRLQEQHYFLDKILTASPSGIITLDFDGRLAMANPSAERLLQAQGDALYGRRLDELPSPLAAALGGLGVGESAVIPVLGRRRVKCQKSQFLDRGFARHFFLLEELTEELRQSEKAAYQKLIRLMSHEVNNTVGSANSLLHSCLHYSGQLAAEDRQDFETALKVVIGRTDQLNAFMRSFADVVRLPPPNPQPGDLISLLEEIALLLRPECVRREITWRWEIADRLRPVALDRGQLEQAFVNVLKNAIEAIGQRGVITIRAGLQGGRRFLTVEDTGGGISPAVKAHLFTPFFSTKEHGQGIGLTLVQEILDQHGFEFSLEGPGGGPTQFTVYLD